MKNFLCLIFSILIFAFFFPKNSYSGRMWGYGFNSIGYEYVDDYHFWTKYDANAPKIGYNIDGYRKISGTADHVIGLTLDGRVVSLGSYFVPELNNVIDIAANYKAAYAITSDGKIYSRRWSSLNDDILGGYPDWREETLFSNKIAKKIILTPSGVIFAFEDGSFGYIGYSSFLSRYVNGIYSTLITVEPDEKYAINARDGEITDVIFWTDKRGWVRKPYIPVGIDWPSELDTAQIKTIFGETWSFDGAVILTEDGIAYIYDPYSGIWRSFSGYNYVYMGGNYFVFTKENIFPEVVFNPTTLEFETPLQIKTITINSAGVPIESIYTTSNEFKIVQNNCQLETPCTVAIQFIPNELIDKSAQLIIKAGSEYSIPLIFNIEEVKEEIKAPAICSSKTVNIDRTIDKSFIILNQTEICNKIENK